MATAQYDSFRQLAKLTTDARLAADLNFTAGVADFIQAAGGRAYAVGGFVRDQAIARLHGIIRESSDIDVEVFHLEFDNLLTLLRRFGQVDLVGASFGIILLANPATGTQIQYSVPRWDSKVDRGHTGFQVTCDPNMSLKEAAQRRDLTINTLSQDILTGEVFDEWGGLADIQQRVLRATDPDLFPDDSLRVLRVMRFHSTLGFRIDDSLTELCRTIDLSDIFSERINKEWTRMLLESDRPSLGLEAARNLGILDQLHPELAALVGVPQDPEWHPEGDVWEHTKCAADAAAWVVRQEQLRGDDALVILYGAICHDLGKATTTARRSKTAPDGTTRLRWTSHGHEQAGVEPARRFLHGLNIKHDIIRQITAIVAVHLYHIGNPHPTDSQLRRFARKLQPANIRLWSLVSRCDSNGRGGPFTVDTPSLAYYRRSLDIQVAERPPARIVTGRDLMAHAGLPAGPALGVVLDFLYEAQIEGRFTSVSQGLAYYDEHQAEIQPLVAECLAAIAAKPRRGLKTRRDQS